MLKSLISSVVLGDVRSNLWGCFGRQDSEQKSASDSCLSVRPKYGCRRLYCDGFTLTKEVGLRGCPSDGSSIRAKVQVKQKCVQSISGGREE